MYFLLSVNVFIDLAHLLHKASIHSDLARGRFIKE